MRLIADLQTRIALLEGEIAPTLAEVWELDDMTGEAKRAEMMDLWDGEELPVSSIHRLRPWSGSLDVFTARYTSGRSEIGLSLDPQVQMWYRQGIPERVRSRATGGYGSTIG